jgi:hypothetical protein
MLDHPLNADGEVALGAKNRRRVDRQCDPMSYFVVTREAGPAWINGKSAFGQPGTGDHATFMNTLHENGLVIVAGPLADSERGRIRVLRLPTPKARRISKIA